MAALSRLDSEARDQFCELFPDPLVGLSDDCDELKRYHGFSLDVPSLQSFVGSSGIKGRRVSMEDESLAVELAPGHLLIGVFDGHGGAFTSSWAKKNLASYVTATTAWTAYCDGGYQSTAAGIQLLKDAMEQAFIDLDQALSSFGKQCGSTAVTAIVTQQHVLVANAGDSRAVLGHSGTTTLQLSTDHKPDHPLEEARIVRAGGTVMRQRDDCARVNGQLGVARAFGDFYLKGQVDLSPGEQFVSCVPEMTVYGRLPDGSDEFLVLACDGLYDVATSDEVIRYVRELLSDGESNMRLVAEELTDWAYYRRSLDNVSALVVRFPGAQISAEGGGVAKVRKQRELSRPPDMYDNVQYMERVKPQPGTLFYDEEDDL